MIRSYLIPPTPSLIKKLIYINISVYLLTMLLNLSNISIVYFFGLVPDLIINRFHIWQLISYIFMHGSLFHLLFNMLMLWMFGGELCRLWGNSFFLKYYLVCGIGAGVCVTVMSYIFPANFYIPTVGASGAIFGLFLAYGLIFKDRYLYVFGLFPIRARRIVIIMGLIELFSLLTHKHSSISHLAHLGGLFVGFVYLKINDYRRKYLKYKYTKWKEEEPESESNIIDAEFEHVDKVKKPENWN